VASLIESRLAIVKSADVTLIRLTYFFCFEGSTYLVQSAVSLKLLMAQQRHLIRAFLKKFEFYRVGLETSGRIVNLIHD
jgi:hypothetical protein